jgi:hypothetical protein
VLRLQHPLMSEQSTATFLSPNRTNQQLNLSRMRIVFAAHGLLMYLIMLDMNELPMNTQLQISRRTLELQYVPCLPPIYCSIIATRRSVPQSQGIACSRTRPSCILRVGLEKKERELLTRPFGGSPTRAVTKLDVESFKDNPFQLVGMSFILQDGSEDIFFEVVEIGSSRRAMWYQVQFEGCVDYVQVDRDEVLEMVSNSIMCIA